MTDPTYRDGHDAGLRWGFWSGVIVGAWIQTLLLIALWWWYS